MNSYSTRRVDGEGGGIRLSPSRFASLGVINICPCGTEKPLHSIYFAFLNNRYEKDPLNSVIFRNFVRKGVCSLTYIIAGKEEKQYIPQDAFAVYLSILSKSYQV
jgi:hypothetical protein